MFTKICRRLHWKRASLILLAGTVAACASTIGTNPPAQSITRKRIEQLPATKRQQWLQYLDRSQQQRITDKIRFQEEMKRSRVVTPIEPPHCNSARGIPLDRAPSWYAGAAARHIADIIVSYQTPAGGWSKNLDMSLHRRKPGEKFAPDNLLKFPAPDDFDVPLDPDWNYVGTIDNDATTTELNFLAKVISAGTLERRTVYLASFLRGIDYLFAAQFPNGGWPQVWPLEGGYHDAITYNDGAMISVMELMRHVAEGKGDFSFVPKKVRRRASARFARGTECILSTQIISKGRPTVWPQQDDPLTLRPESARNFEPPAECASESADVLMLLMNDLPRPTTRELKSIQAAAAWFQKTEIYGQRWSSTADGRNLVPSQGSGPIWARYYQIGTEVPIFGDRDKSIHDNVNELTEERRNGYRWYSNEPLRVLDCFERWKKEHPESE